jgi:hypothetical protein
MERSAFWDCSFTAYVGALAIFISVLVCPTRAGADDWRSTLQAERGKNANKIAQIDAEAQPLLGNYKQAQHEFEQARQAMDAHNSNRCEYPEGQPELCSGWTQQGNELEERQNAAIATRDQLYAQLKPLADEEDRLAARNQAILRQLNNKVQPTVPCKSNDECTVSGCCGSWDGGRGIGMCQPSC